MLQSTPRTTVFTTGGGGRSQTAGLSRGCDATRSTACETELPHGSSKQQRKAGPRFFRKEKSRN